MTLERVKRQRDAHGARCLECESIFMVDTSPYWHWSKSAAMHRGGTGHRVELFRLVDEGRL